MRQYYVHCKYICLTVNMNTYFCLVRFMSRLNLFYLFSSNPIKKVYCLLYICTQTIYFKINCLLHMYSSNLLYKCTASYVYTTTIYYKSLLPLIYVLQQSIIKLYCLLYMWFGKQSIIKTYFILYMYSSNPL